MSKTARSAHFIKGPSDLKHAYGESRNGLSHASALSMRLQGLLKGTSKAAIHSAACIQVVKYLNWAKKKNDSKKPQV